MSVGVIACGAIATHIASVQKANNLDITIYPLPPLLHNQPTKIAGEVEQLLISLAGKHEKFAVAYADCGTYGALDEIVSAHGVKRLGGNHCYDIFAGEKEIATIMESDAGTYFLTDFLVKSFQRSVIVELGLDRYPELRDDYFAHYNRIIWLAQNPTAELEILARHAAEQIALPLEIRIVGESVLEKQILELLN
ncbi:unannotated protein [freshwater metagenome]|uniref:Unannotated protein n=1 Tax=freshwater metagenome TaxID=449393 RepID=A0A6J7XS88_9ZZZZ|nr:DUF1638 domain-containing protein [Actinomycetota bacterium]